MIDTLEISKKLQTNGFTADQATVLTQVIATQEERLASEKSVEDLRNDTNKNFDLMREEMDKNFELIREEMKIMRADTDKNLELMREEMKIMREDTDKNLELMREEMKLIREDMKSLKSDLMGFFKTSMIVTGSLITLFGIGITALAIFKVF